MNNEIFELQQQIKATEDQLIFKRHCVELSGKNYHQMASKKQAGFSMEGANGSPLDLVVNAQAFLIANVIFSTEFGVLEGKLNMLKGKLMVAQQAQNEEG